ncbi:hypothetical protein KUCAC02_036460, partial [Chaenocephalus aceratus]
MVEAHSLSSCFYNAACPLHRLPPDRHAALLQSQVTPPLPPPPPSDRDPVQQSLQVLQQLKEARCCVQRAWGSSSRRRISYGR